MSLLLAQAYQSIEPKAIYEYQKINLSKNPNSLLFNLGLCLLKIGSNIEAIEMFRIIEMDNSFLPAWKYGKCPEERRQK